MKRVLVILFLMLFSSVSYAEEVVVVLPGFDVTINDKKVENEKEEYPFIQYNNITYIPMTWDMTKVLGLSSTWQNETGLNITKAKTRTILLPQGGFINRVDKKYDATIVEFPVMVNGKIIDNLTETYPLLNFKGVTYFPMTYDYMVGAFNSGYTFDQKSGLKVTADKNLELVLPEAEKHVYKLDTQMIQENRLFVNEFFKLEYKYSPTVPMLFYNFGNKALEDHIMTVWSDYYKDDKYVQTVPLMTAYPYMYDSLKYTSGKGLVFFNDYKTVINVEVMPLDLAGIYIKKFEEFRKTTVEFVSKTSIDLDYLKSEGAAYMLVSRLDRHTSGDMSEDAYKYAAIRNLGEDVTIYDNKLFRMGYYEDGEVYSYYADPEEPRLALDTYQSVTMTDELEHTIIHLDSKTDKDEMYTCNVIYLYNEDKELMEILIIKDAIR